MKIHHVGYLTGNIETSAAELNAVYNEFCMKEGWMNIFKPVKAVALGNRMITYFYNINLRFIEFVNAK